MRILLSNDDGYQATGIVQLRHALMRVGHEVVIVAPEYNRSASSSALTLDRPLKAVQAEEDVWYLEHGTPTDCVHVALTGLIDFVPDMVVSGINAGANLGDDTIYSGTVAAALEGRFLGTPAIAISAVHPCDYTSSVEVAIEMIDRLKQQPLQEGTLLNINVPHGPVKGVKVARLGFRHKSDSLKKITAPNGEEVYWIGVNGKASDKGDDTDFHAIENGYVSITPLTSDLTKHSALPAVQAWLK